MNAVKAYYESLGPEFTAALREMLVFDAVICNVDRHFGNFGVMVDNRTNTVVSPAPLFDHGNSLFNFGIVEIFTDLSVWAGIRQVIESVNANAVA